MRVRLVKLFMHGLKRAQLLLQTLDLYDTLVVVALQTSSNRFKASDKELIVLVCSLLQVIVKPC